MELPLYWVDAFTDRVFGGNPAAVVPLESWLEDPLLQRIAFENGLSETAYFVRTGPARARLRWFTPAVEVDLCGHATLATAHVLFRELAQAESPFVFDTRSGPLSVSRKGPLLELDFPSRPALPAEAPPELVRGLGRRPDAALKSERMWLCVYGSASDVCRRRPGPRGARGRDTRQDHHHGTRG
jgi:predicted PhzF superfamily epimerase YddE/YHI9